MQTFLIVSQLKEKQAKEVEKLITQHAIDAINVTHIAPQRTIGIAQVRELKQKIALRPFRGKTKAFIIDDAQLTTPEAQNALLKTLEEPPESTIIILTATNADLLLPTIVSRCQIIEIANGKYQIAKSKLSIFTLQLTTLLSDNKGEKLKLAQDMAKNKEAMLTWLSDMIFITRQKLLDYYKDKNSQSDSFVPSQYINILKTLQKIHTLISTTNVNPRFALENLFLTL